MIIGLLTLIALLFGGGSVDYFYVDKIEEGIKKDIVDKDRKKELQDETKVFTKIVKEFNKSREKQFKELRKKNLERSDNTEYYLAFFEKLNEERIKLQNNTIDIRLSLQEKITDEEWNAIMKRSSDALTKETEKEQRKAIKKNDKNFFREQETAIVTHVADQARRTALLDGLAIYEAVYDQIHDTYENINVNESQNLINKNLTREDILILAEKLNEQRLLLQDAYSVFMITTKKYSTEEDYKVIIKAFNKLLE
jgi:hypothetical protein